MHRRSTPGRHDSKPSAGCRTMPPGTRLWLPATIFMAVPDIGTWSRSHSGRADHGTYSPPERGDHRHVCSMFARLSRHHLTAPGISRQLDWRSRGQNGTARHCPVVAGRKSRGLLVRGFGVRVPGGAPVLTWLFCYPFTLVGGRFPAVVAPRWLVSPDLVGGAAREWQVCRMCIGGPRVPPDAGSATRPGMDADPAAIAPVRRRGGPGQPSGPACRSRMPPVPAWADADHRRKLSAGPPDDDQAAVLEVAEQRRTRR